jgi:hypothetical protein
MGRGNLLVLPGRLLKNPVRCHCGELILRRGDLEVHDLSKTEIASLRSQRRLKNFSNSLGELQNIR